MYRYHGKCLKIARGKIKEDDKYTCPICDHRVKIPRDAARPKLEELQDWQLEIPTLPFQPEEEDTLQEVVDYAQEFREFIRPYTNPVMATPDEVTTQRFYLRKIEGADILLAFETNFFRQALHKWAPVAPEPPEILEHSLSTRKPRPTKQQKMMAALGIDNPDDLPQQFRTKQHTFNKSRKSSDSHSTKAPQPLQPAPQFANRSATPGSGPNSASTSSAPASRGPLSHRIPGPITTGHPDPMYGAFYQNNSPQQAQIHNDYSNPSPTFGWQNRLPAHSHSPGLMHSPVFRTMSPLSGSGSAPPIDPGLFSPTNNAFAASALRMVSGPESAGGLGSPIRDDFGHGPQESGIDNIFAEYTTEDAEGRGEAAEALELGLEGRDEEAERLGEEFLNH